MLRSVKNLESYRVAATDGDIGTIVDFYFDDEAWTVRYLVVDTQRFWQSAHRVLVSPISFRGVDWEKELFQLSLTREKIRQSPSWDLHQPVSRQHESVFNQYYGWGSYWDYAGAFGWGLGAVPSALAQANVDEQARPAPGDIHLRSIEALRHYTVGCTDGELGQVADFIVDDETWRLRYLVLDTHMWWPNKQVLVAPEWVTRISWENREVRFDLTRAAVKSAPEWTAGMTIERSYEEILHAHHGKPGHWIAPPRDAPSPDPR